MHLEGQNRCFMHFLASKHCLGHVWAPPLMKTGYGTTVGRNINAGFFSILHENSDTLPHHDRSGGKIRTKTERLAFLQHARVRSQTADAWALQFSAVQEFFSSAYVQESTKLNKNRTKFNKIHDFWKIPKFLPEIPQKKILHRKNEQNFYNATKFPVCGVIILIPANRKIPILFDSR